MLTIVTRLILS